LPELSYWWICNTGDGGGYILADGKEEYSRCNVEDAG